MSTIHRVVGDHGALARIRITGLQDADGDPITVGPVRLRAAGLFERAMTSTGGGDWYLDPEEGDLDQRGRYALEVAVEGSQVTVPADRPWTLIIRDRVEDHDA